MQIHSIRIQNYKGIQDTTIYLQEKSVIPLIGLNESGKTTILEAISLLPQIVDRINGKEELTTSIFQTAIPRKDCATRSSISIEMILLLPIYNKEENAKKIKIHCFYIEFFKGEDIIDYKSSKDEEMAYEDMTEELTFCKFEEEITIPIIQYFPNLSFDIPEKIDIKDVDTPYIKDDHNKYIELLDLIWCNKANEEKGAFKKALRIDNRPRKDMLDTISKCLSKRLNELWSKITGTNEEELSVQIAIGGDLTLTTEITPKNQDISFYMSERSLGFRWFFAYILFTQFYGEDSNIIFMFDEPASNLHPSAQQRICQNLNDLAETGATVIYSTHSHHLINLVWIGQTYIIQNSAIQPKRAIQAFNASEMNIKAIPYAKFHHDHKDKTYYLQPLEDALGVIISPLDLFSNYALLVEGISDYWAYRYLIKKYFKKDNLIHIIPTNGADSMKHLVPILIGWGVNFLILLDGDNKGIQCSKNYQADYLLDNGIIKNLREIYGGKEDITLEDLFQKDVKDQTVSYWLNNDLSIDQKKGQGPKPKQNSDKTHYALYFRNLIEKKKTPDLPQTEKKVEPIIEWIQKEFNLKRN
ncbi:MAG: hypothetical protein EU981_03335 [Candidatus Liberibacter ctenarytainae]|uniref:AAA domain-containing protein n=1 Tax=Candidatus Liberibacter ctenarytainae TaxID=2020335 RepID=A0A937AFF9_9HYPH|nr:hypothetical protein [Candidatus Liberibacter ctenarytainae]